MNLENIVIDEVKSVMYLYKVCPYCGKEVDPNDKSDKCPKCGHIVKGTL